MVRVSHEQKPYRRIMMETCGVEVYPNPTVPTGRTLALGRSARLTGSPRRGLIRGLDRLIQSPSDPYRESGVVPSFLAPEG